MEAAAGGGESSLELPNLVSIIANFGHGAAWARFLHTWVDMIFTWVVILFLAVFFYLASRPRKLLPGKLQNLAEFIVQSLNDFVISVMGPRGRHYVPFLGTLFIYILTMNLTGLIPGLKSPTSNLNTTLSMALVVFLYVQWTGIRRLGLLGYIDHLAGQPRDVIGWSMVPLLMPIHIIGELAKPVSLSCRLFGNIFGEDVLLAVFVGLGITVLQLVHIPWFGLPLHLPFIFLAIMTSVIQALIFTLLSMIYLFLMLPHEHEHHGSEADDALAPGYPVHPEAARATPAAR